MLIEIVMVICAILMAGCGLYFTISDIRLHNLLKKNWKKKKEEEKETEPKQEG